MQAGEIREGMVVSHAETGALGFVRRGGYGPRIEWYLNGRVVRTDEELLRFAFIDETEMRRASRRREVEAWSDDIETALRDVDVFASDTPNLNAWPQPRVRREFAEWLAARLRGQKNG